MSTTNPSALKGDWSLRYGKPLISPSRAAPEYLACIFTSSLTTALPWLHSWASQILSALAWAQVALASDYAQMTVMRAIHKSVHRVYSASPWNEEDTMRAVYAITHHQPCAQSDVVTRLIHWLSRHAKWHNKHYTDTAIPTELQPEGYEPNWCKDISKGHSEHANAEQIRVFSGFSQFFVQSTKISFRRGGYVYAFRNL